MGVSDLVFLYLATFLFFLNWKIGQLVNRRIELSCIFPATVPHTYTLKCSHTRGALCHSHENGNLSFSIIAPAGSVVISSKNQKLITKNLHFNANDYSLTTNYILDTVPLSAKRCTLVYFFLTIYCFPIRLLLFSTFSSLYTIYE